MWQESAVKLKETIVKVDTWTAISGNVSVVAPHQLYIKSNVFFLCCIYCFYTVKSFAL